MRPSIVFMRTLLNIPYFVRKVTGTGAFGHRGGVYVDTAAKTARAPLQQALWAHYVRQYNASSCSVATLATVINALGSVQGCRRAPVGQRELLETVRVGHWKARMTREGHNGRRGLPLPLLGKVVRAAMAAYGIAVRSVETVQAAQNRQASRSITATLRKRLTNFEARGAGVVIAHFDQGAYVPELNIPHISPVGAYDASRDTVTILDVDPDQPGPYRVSFDTFYRGLSSDYHHVFRPFGYGSGGYVWIEIQAEGV